MVWELLCHREGDDVPVQLGVPLRERPEQGGDGLMQLLHCALWGGRCVAVIPRVTHAWGDKGNRSLLSSLAVTIWGSANAPEARLCVLTPWFLAWRIHVPQTFSPERTKRNGSHPPSKLTGLWSVIPGLWQYKYSEPGMHMHSCVCVYVCSDTGFL